MVVWLFVEQLYPKLIWGVRAGNRWTTARQVVICPGITMETMEGPGCIRGYLRGRGFVTQIGDTAYIGPEKEQCDIWTRSPMKLRQRCCRAL